MNLIKGPRYIEALLVKIDLKKQMFLMDLENGIEVLIPDELSQDHMPPSFRYYDLILMLI